MSARVIPVTVNRPSAGRMKRSRLQRYSLPVLDLTRIAMYSLSKCSDSSLTVVAFRSASRSAAGSSPLRAAAMMVIARLHVLCLFAGQDSAGAKAHPAGPAPARYWTTSPFRPLGRTRSPRPGMSSSQMKYSAALIRASSTMRLVSFGMGDQLSIRLRCFKKSRPFARGSNMEATAIIVARAYVNQSAGGGQ